MTFNLSKYVRTGYHFVDKVGIRHKWMQRGIDPEVGKNLEQKMAEWNAKDPETSFLVDIGFKYVRPGRKDVIAERLKIRREFKSRLEIEKAARTRTLPIDMDGVYDEWQDTVAPFHIKDTANYFNVYQDLFGDAYFTPITMMDIHYAQESGDAPVYQGNLLKPAETTKSPAVTFDGNKDVLYTLVMTTPDCHLTVKNAEYLHWMIGNIPGSDISKGQEICDYLQPFPPRGVGYCRYVFVLYRQDKVIDFSQHQRPANCKNLAARTFSTLEFYRELQDVMTPCGLAFFQSNWDSSLTDFFHNVLDMKEPWFEYDFHEVTLPPQRWFPAGAPFNLYLDKYKDDKTLGRELLLEKLKEVHPFERPPPPPKYPMAIPIKHSVPTWKRDDIHMKRQRKGKYKFM